MPDDVLLLDQIALSPDGRFDGAVRFVLEHETEFFSGHEDDYNKVMAEHVEGDTGGWTKYGIDQATHKDVDVFNLTLEGAVALYERFYWNRNHCPAMAPGWGEVCFDICVNNGRGKASKWLDRALGGDYDFSDTLFPDELVEATHDAPRSQLGDVLDAREAFFRSLAAQSRSQAKFLKGWLARNNDLRRFAAALVAA